MKTTIRIQNFKSLEDVTLELAPTTVFLGPNGAGKSSVLKCLEFIAKQKLEFSTLQNEIFNQKPKSKFINSSFRELVYNNDLNRKIIFEFKHSSSLRFTGSTEAIYSTTNADEDAWWTDINFLRNPTQLDISAFSKNTQKRLFNLYNSNETFIDPMEPPMINLNLHGIRKISFSLQVQFGSVDGITSCEYLRLTDSTSNAFLVYKSDNKINLNNGFHSENFVINEFFQKINKSEFLLCAYANNPGLERDLVAAAIQFFHRKIKQSKEKALEKYLFKTIVQIAKFSSYFPSIFQEYHNIHHIRSVRSAPDEQELLSNFRKYKYNKPWFVDIKSVKIFTENDEENRIDGEPDTSSSQEDNDSEMHDPVNIKNSSEVVSDSISNPKIYGPFGIPDRDILDKIARLLEIEKEIQKIKNSKKKVSKGKYENLSNELQELKNLFDSKYLESEKPLLWITSKWLSRLNLAKEVWFESYNEIAKLKVKSLTGAISDYSESSSGMIQFYPIILKRFLPDIESYPLPFFRTLLIEQPELHLHPALHSEVAELCSNNSISPTTSANFIIETHSEHLIRGYQLLIAKGKINPEKIRFYYFNPVKNKTKVVNLKVDEFGNFITPWPNGFFSEASDLSYKLLEEQLKRQK